jgi:hypothetical protein
MGFPSPPLYLNRPDYHPPHTSKMRKATRSIVRLTAILAAAAPLASAFTCTWRGGDYSWYTYYEDFLPYCCIPSNGNCPNGWVTGYKFCGETFYEDCYNCGTGGAVCCEDPYSKQYQTTAKTQCCQCVGDTVSDPFNWPFLDEHYLTQGDCDAAVRTVVPYMV